MEPIDFIAVDFETATNNRMACQIGISVVRNGKLAETITRYIQPPDNRYDWGCQRIHHITEDMTKDAPDFAHVYEELEHYFVDAPEIWAHNADFDGDVLFKNMMQCGLLEKLLDSLVLGKFHCTMKLYNGKGLKELCKDFGMDTSGHHDAGFDAECCATFRLNYLNGIRPKAPLSPIDDPNNNLRGRKVFIAGKFQTMSRDEIISIVFILGATIEKYISKNVDFVVLGKDVNPSHMEKIEKLQAKGHGIRIVDEDFMRSAWNGDYGDSSSKE